MMKLTIAVLALSAISVTGMPSYLKLIPNSSKSTGHNADMSITPFGTMFSENGHNWEAVCAKQWPGPNDTDKTVAAVMNGDCAALAAPAPGPAPSEATPSVTPAAPVDQGVQEPVDQGEQVEQVPEPNHC